MDRREVYVRGAGLALLALALILLMSLASFNPNDPPGADHPRLDPASNICGIVGAYLAYTVRLFLGTGGYLIAGLMGVIGAFMLIHRDIDDRLMRGIGVAVLILSWCAGIGMLFPNGGWPGGHGGWIGRAIGPGFLSSIGTGGYVIVVLGLTLGALLAADAWVLWVGRKSVQAFTMVGLPKRGGATVAPVDLPTPASAERTRVEPEERMAEQKELLRQRIAEQRASQTKTPPEPPTEDFTDEPPAVRRAGPSTISEAPTLLVKEKEKEKAPEPKPRAARKVKQEQIGDYALPGMDMLDPPDPVNPKAADERVQEKREILERTLEEFGIAAQVVEIDRGPVITQFELELAPGVKIGKIVGLSDDLARALKAISVRVVAPIPGKSTVGIEVPNANREVVRMREIFESGVLERKRLTIPLLLGKDASGEPLIGDLAQMPHMLIAGATGSGKSVCMNSVIMTFLLTQSPTNLKLLLIDPKMVELSAFREVPHLICPVVTDMKKAASTLEWATKKMDERYSLLANVGVRNIAGYNALGEKEIRKRLEAAPDEDIEGVPFHMPYIIIIIDELADLMMVSAKEVENTITRLAQKSRAVGIHLIVATQRPSVDVVTGLIKANLPCRLAFQTASKIDSRTILDRNGGEKLLGRGDMLFLPPGSSKLTRGQGCFTSDEEIRRITTYLSDRAKPQFEQELVRPRNDAEDEMAEADPFFMDAVRVVVENQRGSVSLLQRKLGIGYGRAARLIDLMGEAGIIGEYKGSQAREVMYTLEEWDARHGTGGPTISQEPAGEESEAT